MNYFSPDKEPVGLQGRSLVIVPGVHARLSNIDKDGKWIENESFEVAGKLIKRQKGQSVGNIMLPWRKLRASAPELFTQISLMQQPAAVADSIITTWSVAELGRQFPITLWQRDMSGGGGFSVQAKQAMALSNQVPCWIAGFLMEKQA